MDSNRIIILGAGFSVPAGVPTQQQLLKNIMTPPDGFLSSSEKYSEKYLLSFIRIGIFLLEQYSRFDVSKIKEQYSQLISFIDASTDKLSTIKKLQSDLKLETYVTDEMSVKAYSDIVYTIDEFCGKLFISYDKYCTGLYLIKEEISSAMKESELNVDLEDVFTNIDNCIKRQTNFGCYDYIQIIRLRNDLLNLFIYHLDNANLALKYDKYSNFIKYLRDNSPTIISLNWDVVLENLLSNSSINYDLCLNKEYWIDDCKRKRRRNKDINLYKIHGSINWLRCHGCGTVNIIKSQSMHDYFFSDKDKPYCFNCMKTDSRETLLQPEIVTPTMLKSFDEQLYKNLWKGAASAIAKASEIMFIGYSLPLADFDFRYILKNNTKRSCKIKVILAPCDAPDKSSNPPEDRYKTLFSAQDSDIIFEYNGVERAIL